MRFSITRTRGFTRDEQSPTDAALVPLHRRDARVRRRAQRRDATISDKPRQTPPGPPPPLSACGACRYRVDAAEVVGYRQGSRSAGTFGVRQNVCAIDASSSRKRKVTKPSRTSFGASKSYEVVVLERRVVTTSAMDEEPKRSFSWFHELSRPRSPPAPPSRWSRRFGTAAARAARPRSRTSSPPGAAASSGSLSRVGAPPAPPPCGTSRSG